MTKEIYENSILDDLTEAIEEQETEFCEDAARNVIGVVTDCLKLNIREKPTKDSRVVTVVTCLDELEVEWAILMMIGTLSALLPVSKDSV